MSFQRFDSPPNTQTKRPHLSIFRFTSFQSNNLRPSMEPPAYSPNDELAAKAQLQAKILKYMRCALAFLTLAISVTVLACSAKSLRSYSETRDNAEWVLPLWPTSVDLRPTRALLSCGVILTVASLLYLVAALVPTVCLPGFQSRLQPANCSVASRLTPFTQHPFHGHGLFGSFYDHLHHHLDLHHQLPPRIQHRCRHALHLDMQMARLRINRTAAIRLHLHGEHGSNEPGRLAHRPPGIKCACCGMGLVD